MKHELNITDSSALDAINRLVDFGMNPDPMLEILGGRLTNRVRMSFKNATDPYGTPWARITHRQGQPLSHTRRLRGSIDHNVLSDGQNHALEIGTNTVYAKLHQFGGQGKKAQVPAFTRIQRFAWGRRIAPRPVRVKAHTRTMNQKARPFLPTAAKGLPESWDRSATAAIINAMNQAMKGRQ